LKGWLRGDGVGAMGTAWQAVRGTTALPGKPSLLPWVVQLNNC
jgi:hypothetical protein